MPNTNDVEVIPEQKDRSILQLPILNELSTNNWLIVTTSTKTYRMSANVFAMLLSGVVVDKVSLGLERVDNTSDAEKPLSIAAVEALALKAEAVHTHEVSDIDGLKEFIETTVGEVLTVRNFATAEELTAGLELKADKTELILYVKDEELDAKVSALLSAESSGAKTAVESIVNGIVSTAVEPLAVKTEVEEALELKADKDALEDYVTKDAHQTDLDTKVDKVENEETVTGIVSRLETLETDTTKATKQELADGLATKVDNEVLNTLATKTEVTEGLALKAEKTDLETLVNEDDLAQAIEPKADKVYVDNALSEAVEPLAVKAEVDSALELKADKTYVDELVEPLAVKSEVEAALELKADKSELTEGLELKADKTYVNEVIEPLAIKAEVEAALELKADKSDIESLVSETDLSEAVEPLATKVEVNEGLALKADITYVDAAVEPLAVKADVDSALELKADKTTVDDAIASLATKEELNTAVSDKITEQFMINYIDENAVGETPYETAVRLGFEGTEEEWLLSLKGEDGQRGIQGEPGPVGPPMNLLGVLSDADLLPDPADYSANDAYVAGSDWYAIINGDWVKLGTAVGPEGKSAFEIWKIANDLPDATLEEYLEANRGRDGIGLVIRGVLASTDLLPTDPENGDTYIVDYQMWVWASTEWAPVGQQGPEGKSAFVIWKEDTNNPEASVQDFLEAIKGEKGDQGDVGDIGPQGIPGHGLQIDDLFDNVEDLPAEAEEGATCLVAGEFLYVFLDNAWNEAGTIKGDKGEPGVDGNDGSPGEQGIPGPSLIVKGELADVEALPVDGNVVGDTYYVGETKVQHSWDGEAWISAGAFIGLKGDKGDPGQDGEQGIPGEPGVPGPSLIVKGELAAVEELPETENVIGDTYYIGDTKVQHTWNGERWVAAGAFIGPKGLKGDKGDPGQDGEQGIPGQPGPSLNIKGQLTTVEELPSEENVSGDTYYVGETKVQHTWNGSAWVDSGAFIGPKGDKGEPGENGSEGEQGLPGPSLVVKGHLGTSDELPSEDNAVGDTYYVGDDNVQYSWNGSAWANAGATKGEKGDKGDPGEPGEQGIPGLAGNDGADGLSNYDLWKTIPGNEELTLADFLNSVRGEKGEEGPQGPEGQMGPGVRIVGRVLTMEELPESAENIGDIWIVGSGSTHDAMVWDGTGFFSAGNIQGPRGYQGLQGPKGEDGAQGPRGIQGEQGIQGSLWILLPREPGPVDGRVGDFFLNTSTLDAFQKVNSTTWAVLGKLGGGNVFDAPEDNKSYLRHNREWKETKIEDRYHLAISNTEGDLDLDEQQSFIIDITTDKTITVSNAPANRAMTVVLVFKGTGGVVNWFEGITWNGDAPPALGDTRTVVVLFWDGSEWMGSEGPKL